MHIPQTGMPRETVLENLAAYKQNDLEWRSGRVMAYVYDPGAETESLAKEAYTQFLSESGLDPTTFPSVHRLETEVVRMIINLLRGDEHVVGNCTSGGTESIMCAVKTARDWARAHRPHITAPEIIIPQTAHGAFHKACVYLGLTPVVTAYDPVTCRADVDAMRDAITPNTILLVGSAPSYGHGVIDPLPEIAALAQELALLCHVDGCVGGIHLSFMREMDGYDIPDFDFSLPGVTSISADMHKYGYAPKNMSVVMYRNKELRFHQIFSCFRTATYALVNPTVMSTKSGGPYAGSWAVLQHLGREGYERIIRGVMDATTRLVDGVNAIEGLRVLGKPDMCMFSFTSDEFNIFELADEMRDRGWYLQPQFSTGITPENLHITVNQSALEQVEPLLAALSEGVAALRERGPAFDKAAVQSAVQQLLAASGEGAVPFEELAGMAGLTGTDLPDKMGLINTVMDALPDPVAEAILSSFINDIYV